jgi:hypothetical protein
MLSKPLQILKLSVLWSLSLCLLACPSDPPPGPGDDASIDSSIDISSDAIPSDAQDVGPTDTAPEDGSPEDANPSDGHSCQEDSDCPSADAVTCVQAVCVEGSCKYVQADEGTPCVDDDACKTNAACDSLGQCAGTPIDCDDGNSCTEDLCSPDVGECAHLPTPKADCTDNDSCTENDQCSDDGICLGVAKECDDADNCTVDSCTDGDCQYLPSGLCSTLLEESFDCEGAQGAWEYSVLEGVITWAVDGLPDPPGAYSGGCSLNFNDDGNDYDSPAGAPSFGQAISPVIDASALAIGTPLYLSFYNYWQTEDEPNSNWDKRGLEVSTDGFESSEEFNVGHTDDNENTWFPTVVDLSAYAGKTFQFRFYFDTVDSVSNDGVGWFIDDVVVATTPPELPPEVCDDNQDNDFDLKEDCADSDCAFDPACVKLGDTCNSPLDLDVSALPVSVVGNTSEFEPHYGYPEGACPGETGGWGGGIGSGAPDMVYAFTAPSTDDYIIQATGQGYDTNIYLVTDCDDIANSCVAGSDNALEGKTETLIVGLTEGTAYFLIIDGWSLTDPENAGPFELVVDLAPEFDCNDGQDNDGNGLIDCADPTCANAPVCIPESNCNDGEDNDEDGDTDCTDADCAANCDEASNCNDGIDNDQNGQVDCEDDACILLPACLNEICNDGEDNDGDGQSDCNDDECYGNPPCKNVGNNCNNSIVINAANLPFSGQGDTSKYKQNYGYSADSCPGETGGWGGGKDQGSPDMVYKFTPLEEGHYTITVIPEYDANLYVAETCNNIDNTCLGASEVPGPTEESLSLTLAAGQTVFIFVDGWQNNADNVAGEFVLNVGLADESDCGDGIDNDNAGGTDCDDAACALSHECIPEDCFNGADDDGDGTADCEDSECADNCDESLNCDDGKDNDDDGKTDCQDSDCNGTLACEPEVCDDGEDNDADGKIDCDDVECDNALACKEAGDDCTKPFAIDALPYSNTVSTCAYTNTVTAQAGGGCYIGGQNMPENVYAYTAEDTMSVTFTVTPGAEDANLLLNIASACAATITECIGGSNPLGDSPTTTVEVQSGQTYYIIVDGFSGFFPPTCGDYTLTVTPILKEAGKCTDGLDNDDDGQTDCADTECENEPVCGCQIDGDCPNADACSEGTCDAATGQCSTKALNCNDNEVCTNDSCDAQSGCINTPVVCDDGVSCTTDFCSNGIGCGSALNHIKCDDGSVCTDDLCDKLNDCVYTAIDCNDGFACTVDSCDDGSGCVQTPQDEDCDDGESCTTNICDPNAGCVNDAIEGCDGASCESAIAIPTLPFSTTGDTTGYEDTVSFTSDSCVIDTTTSLSLDGIDSHITFEQGPEFDYTEAEGISLGFWIRLPLGFGNPGMIVVQGPASWYMAVNGFQALSWRPVAPVTATTGNGALIEGLWHYVVATYDNTSFEAKLFVDGDEKSSSVGEGPLNYAAGLQPHLGRNWSALNLQPLLGNIDEFAIFNRALDPSEIMDLFTGSGMAPESMAPDHWWRMGEGDTFPTLKNQGTLSSEGTIQKGVPADFEAETVEQPGGGVDAGNAIYTVTAASDGLHRATVSSSFGATLYVVEDCKEPSNTCLGMDMVTGPGPVEVVWMATEGSTYSIVVDGTDGAEGNFELSVQAF